MWSRWASPPFREGFEGSVERLAERRERVHDLRWDLLVDLAVHDAISLQLAELLGEHLLADARQLPP